MKRLAACVFIAVLCAEAASAQASAEQTIGC